MTDTIQVRSYIRKKPSSAQAYEALRRERLDQLRRETEARKARADQPVAVLDFVPPERKPGPMERAMRQAFDIIRGRR